MGWNFSQGKPIYLQIIGHIQAMILSGEYMPGDKIESVREFASLAGVNPNTMQKALQEMESMGLIITQRTSGRYITEDEKKIRELRDQVALSKTQSYISDLEKLGYKIDEIEAFVLQYKKKQSKARGNLEDLMREELKKSGKNNIEL